MRVHLCWALLPLLLAAVCEGNRQNGQSSARKKSKGNERGQMRRKFHQLLEINEKASKRLADLNDYTRFYNEFLKHILRVRVPGTVGHHEVKEFIIKKLNEFKWDVKIDEFVNETPLGPKRFTNIIATWNINAPRRLALAAHYDSKLLAPVDGKYFVAATDSAVPCAMLLDIAQIANRLDLAKTKSRDVSLQLIFLDGEEALVEWTKDDSIYGARHLADVFEKAPMPVPTNGNTRQLGQTMLNSLDAFVLLDLIGAEHPQFYDTFDNTSCLYSSLQKIEQDLSAHNLLTPHPMHYFPGKPRYPLYVEDDHLPFLRKGVPILHLITIPFPKAWHTVDDDESILHQPTIENLLKIFRVFAAEYVHFDITKCDLTQG